MTTTNTANKQSAFREIPFMGVIWVVAEAMQLGYYNGHPDWCNLGQGQPEVGPMAGAPERITTINIQPGEHAYGPVGGTTALREAIAAHYNRLFRQGKASQYTAANVGVGMGGRLLLARVFHALGKGKVGFRLPDYSAYEDLFKYQAGRVTPVRLPSSRENGFHVPGADIESLIQSNDLMAFLTSNPCNPTGHVIAGEELEAYVQAARETGCAMIMDEFYSHFIYKGSEPGDGPVSAAAYVEDVNSDPVLLIDGLTKSYRYPGWRVGWALGPEAMISTLDRVASAIDGGPSQPIQQAAIKALEPQQADQETEALRVAFSRKRNLMLAALDEMGITYDPEPQGTFYVWANLENLPAPLNNADGFFRKALEQKVLTVPGRFFDIHSPDPSPEGSEYAQWMRFSYGPPEEVVKVGLERLKAMVQEAKG